MGLTSKEALVHRERTDAHLRQEIGTAPSRIGGIGPGVGHGGDGSAENSICCAWRERERENWSINVMHGPAFFVLGFWDCIAFRLNTARRAWHLHVADGTTWTARFKYSILVESFHRHLWFFWWFLPWRPTKLRTRAGINASFDLIWSVK